MDGLIDALWQGGTPALLALTFVLSAVIGIEREWHSFASGIRPCVLAAVGAAAFSDFIIGRMPSSGWGRASARS